MAIELKKYFILFFGLVLKNKIKYFFKSFVAKPVPGKSRGSSFAIPCSPFPDCRLALEMY